jgi:hypothetical protein
MKAVNMKILFSPSETKTTLKHMPAIHPSCFIFPELYPQRLEVLTRYQNLLDTAELAALSRLFGIQDPSKHESIRLFDDLTCKAIERYDGVAYDYLNYASLDAASQTYLDQNVMIFSNLFGPILASDAIPYYKLHQGESLQGFKPERFYKEHFSDAIDAWIADEPLLDLRAGFYEKFYVAKKPTVTMKFLKNGKVLNHFAKAYRGIVLQRVAKANVQDESELQNICFENLRIVEIQQRKLTREYVFEIIE